MGEGTQGVTMTQGTAEGPSEIDESSLPWTSCRDLGGGSGSRTWCEWKADLGRKRHRDNIYVERCTMYIDVFRSNILNVWKGDVSVGADILLWFGGRTPPISRLLTSDPGFEMEVRQPRRLSGLMMGEGGREAALRKRGDAR